jgi:hypothetical protein
MMLPPQRAICNDHEMQRTQRQSRDTQRVDERLINITDPDAYGSKVTFKRGAS